MAKPKACSTSGCEELTTARYCDTHRCQTDGCKHKRQGTGRHCSRHNLCKKKDCTEPILQCEDGIAHGIFCDVHSWTCRKLDCPNDISETSECPGAYCTDHTCRSSGCQVALIGQDDKSPFCKDHRCLVEGCEDGGAYRPQGYRYCYTHGCDVDGCKNMTKKDDSTATLSKKCSDHACNAAGCLGAREEGRKYCGDHASCGKDKCKSLKHPTERFCQGHANTCVKPDCFAERDWTGHWESYLYKAHLIRADEYRRYWVKDSPLDCCSNHACRADGCSAPMQFDRKRRYCEEHDECGKKDCAASRFVTQRFCPAHEGLCNREDCFRARAGDLGSLCAKHGCVAPSCGMTRRENDMYCADHIACGAPDCAVICELPQMACEDHRCKCYDSGCYKAVCSSETDYCKDHVCSNESCHEARESAFDSSVSHTLCANHYEAYRSSKMRKKTKHGKVAHGSKSGHKHRHGASSDSNPRNPRVAPADVEAIAPTYAEHGPEDGVSGDYVYAQAPALADTPEAQAEYGAGDHYTTAVTPS
ncbi:hypothetical protein GE09DRAFT_1194284 [Coniochaeta sp. 2T2.1]|nr:hypothetical protein GE09DRAFT_1194284 [Coniochaeta sp. 2T2.1]